MVEEVTEAMFSEQNAFYVEVLDGNYHYADIIGFSLVNEKGHYYIPTETALGSNAFKVAWQKMKRRKRQSMMLNVRKYHSDTRNSPKWGYFDLLLASYLANPSETD